MLVHRQAGFTLVELMVAMVVGTIIILGAGQLFLTTFQTFQKVEEISRKQETIVFATSILVNEYRKESTGYTLDVTSGTTDDCSIKNPSGRPILDGLAKNSGSCDSDRFVSPDQSLPGYYNFTLDFKREDGSLETISFNVMSRNVSYMMLAENNIAISSDPLMSGKFHANDSVTSYPGSYRITSAVNDEDDRVNIPDPAQVSFLSAVQKSPDVQKLIDLGSGCIIGDMIDPIVYCDGSINGDISTQSLDSNVSIIVVEDDVTHSVGDRSIDVSTVAGGDVTINNSGSGYIHFNGIAWSGGDFTFSGGADSQINGRIMASGSNSGSDGDVTISSGVERLTYQRIGAFFDAIEDANNINAPSFP